MISTQYGGSDGYRLDLVDNGDLVVVRSRQRGTRPERTPLARHSREVMELLRRFRLPRCWRQRLPGTRRRRRTARRRPRPDPSLQFAGRGLADPAGEPVVDTENAFVKFADTAAGGHCRALLRTHGFTPQRPVLYLRNAYFVGTEKGTGRDIFGRAAELPDRDEVVLCHPELVRRRMHRRAFPPQWHLRITVSGVKIHAHANVERAWRLATGEGTTIAVIAVGVTSTTRSSRPRTRSWRRGRSARSRRTTHGRGSATIMAPRRRASPADGRFGAYGSRPPPA